MLQSRKVSRIISIIGRQIRSNIGSKEKENGIFSRGYQT